MKCLPHLFVLKVLPFIFNCQPFSTISLMEDRQGLMLDVVSKLQLYATCTLLNFMRVFELDACCRKTALSVGLYVLAYAEEHFV